MEWTMHMFAGGEEEGLTRITAVGEVTSTYLLEAYRTIALTAPTGAVLWDLSAASLGSLHIDDLRALAVAARGSLPRRPGARAAIVCAREVDYGIARQLITLLSLEDSPAHMAVFRDRVVARNWLLAPERVR